jgi:glycosyltransferase involved in cell wall biosynthesis
MTKKVLRSCAITTSDSVYMAERMRELGAGEVMVFPFGLEALPKQNAKKQPWLCFANRGLEPIYRPQRVIEAFARVATAQREARLVVANDGSLRAALEAEVAARGLADRVSFVGRLDAQAQAAHYARSTWFLSLPESDSVSVSVLEAMAHGCVPLLSELPANREVIGDSARGLIVGSLDDLPARMAALDAAKLAVINREWVAAHGLFEPHVQRFLTRLKELTPA